MREEGFIMYFRVDFLFFFLLLFIYYYYFFFFGSESANCAEMIDAGIFFIYVIFFLKLLPENCEI